MKRRYIAIAAFTLGLTGLGTWIGSGNNGNSCWEMTQSVTKIAVVVHILLQFIHLFFGGCKAITLCGLASIIEHRIRFNINGQ